MASVSPEGPVPGQEQEDATTRALALWVVRGRATFTMRELRTRTHGAWAITVVFSKTVQKVASTQTLPVRVR